LSGFREDTSLRSIQSRRNKHTTDVAVEKVQFPSKHPKFGGYKMS
jgi:hypothetical protein